MFFYCDGIVSSTFKTVIVCYQHALFATNHANSCDDIAAWYALLRPHILISSKLADLKERAPLVKHLINPLSGQEFVPLFCDFPLTLAHI